MGLPSGRGRFEDGEHDVIKTADALTALAMALGVFVQVRSEYWGLAALMGVIGLAALAHLAVVVRSERRQS